jgi:intracellular sulfur oxidation DsrE/DsrF family protein
MKRFAVLFAATAVCAAAAFLLAALVAAQTRQPASSSVATADKKDVEKGQHRVVLQVDSNDAAAMNLTLNNAANIDQYYSDKGELVEIEVVTFGPGLHMLRDDTSPVKDRIKSMAESRPSVTFKACGNTQANMSKAEKKQVPLVAQASVVPSGVVRILELQEKGWSYIRP